jgi:chromosome segregation ATPase
MEEKERFEILLEHMDKNIQTVLEGHMSLKGEIERNHAEAKDLNRETNLKLDVIAQTLSGKIEQVDQKVDINRQEIVRNREAIEINSKKIDQVDQKVENNREAIEINRQEIVRTRDKIKDVDDNLSTNLENHEERIKVLEVIN